MSDIYNVTESIADEIRSIAAEMGMGKKKKRSADDEPIEKYHDTGYRTKQPVQGRKVTFSKQYSDEHDGSEGRNAISIAQNHPWIPKPITTKAEADKGPPHPAKIKGLKRGTKEYNDAKKAYQQFHLKKESFEFTADEMLENGNEAITLDLVKEGFKLHYTISCGDTIIASGLGVTKNGIFCEATRTVTNLLEEVDHKDGQLDRVKSIVNSLISSK
jgi:hypothetical protein